MGLRKEKAEGKGKGKGKKSLKGEENKPPKDKEKKEKKEKKKKGKDPNAPKRPMSAYFLFMNDNRETVQSENPGMKIGEISKLLGQSGLKWGAEEKEKYQ